MDFIEVKYLILNLNDCRCLKEKSDNEVTSFPAHKTHRDLLEKNKDECILILVIYWKKTGL